MWKIIALLLVFSVPASSQVPGAEPPRHPIALPGAFDTGVPAGTLRTAAEREGWRLGLAVGRVPLAQTREAAREPNWIARHPVLFGLVVGAVAGAATSAIMENELFCSGGDEDCVFHGVTRVPTGAAMGAGVGAAVGALVGLARR